MRFPRLKQCSREQYSAIMLQLTMNILAIILLVCLEHGRVCLIGQCTTVKNHEYYLQQVNRLFFSITPQK